MVKGEIKEGDDDIDGFFTNDASLSDAKAKAKGVRFGNEEEVDESGVRTTNNNSSTSKTGLSLSARISSKRRFSSTRLAMRPSLLARAQCNWRSRYQRRETSEDSDDELEEDERAHLESVLRTNAIFQDVVRRGSLIDLVAAFDRVEYDKGDVIFYQGDADKGYLLIIQEGECSITVDGEEIPDPYGTMKKGAMVGELALLMDKERAATVVSKTNVVAFRLNRASFKQFVAEPLVQAEDIKTEIDKIDYIIDKISGVRKRYGGDIIRKFKPSRFWLWGRWHGTILQQASKVAIANMLVSAIFVVAIHVFCQPGWAPGHVPDPEHKIISKLIPLAKLWRYLMTITTCYYYHFDVLFGAGLHYVEKNICDYAKDPGANQRHRITCCVCSGT